MADGDVASRPRARKRVTKATGWREYERRKQEFLGRKPNASPMEFEQFLRHLARRLGL